MKTLLLLILLCYANLSFAQNSGSKNKAAQKAYTEAGRYIAYKSYAEAIELLKEAIAKDNAFVAAYQQLGDIYRKTRNYQESKSYYQEVLKLNPEFHSLTYFGLAESELNTGDYQNALKHLKKYAAYPNLSESNKKLAAKFITDAEFSITAVKQPVTFKPVNLGESINSRAMEYLPAITADEEILIYTRMSNRNEDFFKSRKINENWNKSEFLSWTINSKDNEGAQCISPDGMYLFFTGCNRPDGMGSCDIYISRREGKEWSQPFNIGAPVNTPGWESQPSLSADGRTLYFVSTRANGLGGYDIWKSDLKDGGEWSAPVNLGPSVNTPYDEQSPFIHPDDQTLYFSSNGWPGLGNKDIFMSRADKNTGNWQTPLNLGYPINTFGEESSLTISSNGRTAFFASDQKGGFGGMDIYSFELPEKLRPNKVTYVKGEIVDKETNEPLDGKVQIINLANGKAVYDDTADPETGEFLATMVIGNTFALNAAKEGYMFFSENFSLKGTSNAPYHIKVPLQKIKVGEAVTLKNVFFETNKFDLLPESKVELQQLITFLQKNPKVAIEISGHTDNVGDDRTNMTLSESRAKSVFDYLLVNKVNPVRLTYKGYGETRPAGENDTEEGRQRNRRTEFMITKNQ